MESEGSFEVDEWEEAEKVALRAVMGVNGGEDEDMDVDTTGESLFALMRQAVETRVVKDGRWREE